MLLIIVLLCTLQVRVALSAYIIDRWSQEGIHYEDYCPKMKYCPVEGSHVMCMYFNPNSSIQAGPHCAGFQNISITEEIADKLLYIVNEIRGRIARGLETGKDDKQLPRAYGLFRLKWDNELATFAQVLANTCRFKRDYCRATAKFSEPVQLIYGSRFRLDDWQPTDDRNTVFSTKSLSREQLEYTAKRGFELAYASKKDVTLEMMQPYAELNKSEPKYLQLVDGTTTHIGCGISSYVEYRYYTVNPVSNLIHVVCNFSSKRTSGQETYNTDNPYNNPNSPHFSKCGCPEGSEEDDECLCSLIEDRKSGCGLDETCKPSIVLLPIFTVEEDAPNALKRRSRSFLRKNGQQRRNGVEWSSDNGSKSQRIPATFQNAARKSELGPDMSPFPSKQQHITPLIPSESSIPMFPRSQFPADSFTEYSPHLSGSIPPFPPMAEPGSNNDGRRFEVNYEQPNVDQLSLPSMTQTRRKASIFAAAPKFSLHDVMPNTMTQKLKQSNGIRVNFVPKKASKAQQMVNAYIRQKNIQLGVQSNKSPALAFNDVLKETLQGISNKQHQKKTIIAQPFTLNEQLTEDVTINEEFDDKLMTLLDTLEQEVNRIELGANEKEIFDARIRKIYGTAVGKNPVFNDESSGRDEQSQSETDFEENYRLENIEDANKKTINNDMYETEDKVNELHSDKNKFKSQSRLHNGNNLSPFEDFNQDPEEFDNIYDVVKKRYPNKRRPTNDFNNNNYDTNQRIKSTVLENRIINPKNQFKDFVDQRDLRLNPKVIRQNKKTGHGFNENGYGKENIQQLNINGNRGGQSDKLNEYKNNDDDSKRDYASYEGDEYERRQSNDYIERERAPMLSDYDYGYADEDVLGLERRKYYQAKLDRLKKRSHQKETTERVRARRLMRGNGFSNHIRPLEMNPQFYLPNRARFIHGYR